MNPFQEIKKVPPMRGVAWRGEVSLWNVDTAFSRLYDRAVESKLMFRQPAVGLRHDGVGIPERFRSDYEILFPVITSYSIHYTKLYDAVVYDPPGGRRNQTGDRLEECGFSGPVRTEDRQNLSRPGGEGDPGNGPDLAEPDREVFHLQVHSDASVMPRCDVPPPMGHIDADRPDFPPRRNNFV